jgi:hypothetical protein
MQPARLVRALGLLLVLGLGGLVVGCGSAATQAPAAGEAPAQTSKRDQLKNFRNKQLKGAEPQGGALGTGESRKKSGP